MRSVWTLIILALIPGLGIAAVPLGIVEGFYGDPWSHEERLDMIEFLGDHGLDLYIYAPKEDPQHRQSWREPYGEERMDEFRELVASCEAVGVNLCFAMSPGVDMVYTDPDDQMALLDKLTCLHESGVTHFALFLDDIDPDRMDEADRERFDTAAEAHMYLCNTVLEQLLEREPEAWFLMCPTEYSGVEDSEYLTTLRETLDPRIHVVWTGPEVISPTITDEDIDAITEILGRPPFIWDNYPVNDYVADHLHLGPLVGRTPRLPERISGHASNPMNQAHASMIALATIADYLHDPDGYEPEASWREAIEEIGGEASVDLQTFAEFSRAGRLEMEESRPLNALVSERLSDPSLGNRVRMRRAIDDLTELCNRLPDEIDPDLAEDLDDHIDALGRRLMLMDVCLDFIEGLRQGSSLAAFLRFIDEEQRADAILAAGPVDRLVETAVGLTSGSTQIHQPAHRIDGFNSSWRGADELHIFTPEHVSPETGTNPYGYEATVVNGVVVSAEGNNSMIPADGYIVSGHGTAHRWIEANLLPGVTVELGENEVRFTSIPADLLTPERRVIAARMETLELLAQRVRDKSPYETLSAVRDVLREIDSLVEEGESADMDRLDALQTRLGTFRSRDYSALHSQ
ncbi:beta-N-acetylglucosaminidase domain-containing protein [Candidatus Sumerlaeota bacterium]|nr:beta-N-acetylglucosaminidase domain-containing protein [Candidatus Sumerlaeota bacterium]